jgi:broad specificity phosphatase PhoE
MPLPNKSFYFIRHGETDWNKRHIIMGSIDIPLNDLGITESQQAASILKKEKFDAIISSPRIRALKTAQVIAEQVKINRPIIINTQITEREWGDAEGKRIDPTKDLFNDEDTPHGAETFSAFTVRVLGAVSLILLEHNCPLIVSHGGVFKALADSLGHKNLQALNCSPILFKPAKNFWSVHNLVNESLDF